MSDIREITLKECAELILKTERPLVVMHIRPDGDTVGSGAALCEVFAQLGKRAPYICCDPIPERLSFLVEGLERVKGGEGYEAVAIDVPSPMQLGAVSDKLKVKLVIDHHEVNTPYAPHYTVGDASSAGEVLFGIVGELISRGKIKLTEKIAERIYAAIFSDTGGFAYSNTSEETFRAAAELVKTGIDHADIARRLHSSKTREQIRAEGYIASKLRTAAEGKISYATLTRKEREEEELPFECFETAIDVVRSLIGSEISFVVKEIDTGEYKASLRSVGANVAEVAARYSGGGHIRAAGCTIPAESIDKAAEILICELRKIL